MLELPIPEKVEKAMDTCVRDFTQETFCGDWVTLLTWAPKYQEWSQSGNLKRDYKLLGIIWILKQRIIIPLEQTTMDRSPFL